MGPPEKDKYETLLNLTERSRQVLTSDMKQSVFIAMPVIRSGSLEDEPHLEQLPSSGPPKMPRDAT